MAIKGLRQRHWKQLGALSTVLKTVKLSEAQRHPVRDDNAKIFVDIGGQGPAVYRRT